MWLPAETHLRLIFQSVTSRDSLPAIESMSFTKSRKDTDLAAKAFQETWILTRWIVESRNKNQQKQ